MLKISDIVNTTGLFQAAFKMRLQTSAGVDGITLEQFRNSLGQAVLRDKIIDSLITGEYQPQPLRKKLIPKPNGTSREIFIPTVQDRAIQKMIVMGLNPVVEKRFLNQSYGFRPCRSTQQAASKASRLIEQGFKVCVLIDLENFFGNINRERLRKLLRDYNLDDETRNLINRFIKAPIRNSNRNDRNGVPAGIPLAPLMANIYLHPLDLYLAESEIRFIRYADDITLFFRNIDDCHSFLNEFWGICEQRFRIRINRQKTKIIAEGKRPVLGFEIDDYGGVTYSAKVIDRIQESLNGLLADPQIPLVEIKKEIRAGLLSRLAYYKDIDDFDDLKNKFELIQEATRDKLNEKYSLLELISAAGIKLDRLKEHVCYSTQDILLELLPPLSK